MKILRVLTVLFAAAAFPGAMCSNCSDIIKSENPTGFTLTVTVKDSLAAPVAGAAVKVNYRVTQKISIDGVEYVSFTRPRTDASGVVAFPGLPYELDTGPINYTVTAYKSGFDTPAATAVGVVTDPTPGVSAEVILTAQVGTYDLKMALLEYETSYRASDFLTREKLLFTDITGTLGEADLAGAGYKIIGVGYDSSKYESYRQELYANRDKVMNFVSAGGTLFFFQQNDAGWDQNLFPTPLALAPENNGMNDFSSGRVATAGHTLASGGASGTALADVADLSLWDFCEPGKTSHSYRVVFDAIQPGGGSWVGILDAPGTGAENGFAVGSHWIAAELDHGTGKIFMCQGAYYQGSYGTVTAAGAIHMKEHIIAYLKERAP